jgi:hypothetical protein
MVGERPVQRDLQLLAVRPLFAQLFSRGARFGDEPRIVLVQLCDFVLLDDQRLVRLAQFGCSCWTCCSCRRASCSRCSPLPVR